MRSRSALRALGAVVCTAALGLLACPAEAQPKGKGKGSPATPAAESDNPYADPGPAAGPPPAAVPAAPPTPDTPAPEASPEASRPAGPAPAAAVRAPDARGSAMRAYHAALAARKLAATVPLSRQRLREELGDIEKKLLDGRRDEAIGALVALVESPRFDAFAKTDEGRAMKYHLGDALGRAGVYEASRAYLVALLDGAPTDTWYRRAARSLVDFGLESHDPRPFIADLAKVGGGAPEELRGDIAYLRGRGLEREKKLAAALVEYAKVTPRSRFWAQATYLSGLVEVERGRLAQGERLFCRVADAKLTPKQAPLYGGTEFFRVRDLSRLALGRVAHEQFRFDDSRYYYYLVPNDSEHLPEALYESATSRYEKKDYESARQLLDELSALQRNHPYEDEAWVLDAFVHMAVCEFDAADVKLGEFLKRYEPVRDGVRRLLKDDTAMRQLLDAVRVGADPGASGTGLAQADARAIGALLRLDSAYAASSLRIAHTEHQISGLRGAMTELDAARARLADPKKVRAQAEGAISGSPAEKLQAIDAQIAEVRRLLRSVSGGKRAGAVEQLRRDLEVLEVAARAARAAAAPTVLAATSQSADLTEMLRADRERATQLHGEAEALRTKLVAEQVELARSALGRLDRRLSRLLARARLGRIETVLGRKRSLEIEIEALSQGLLPQSAVDSLDAARFLRDDEEYWPFDGEDWDDEYVGGEGLR